MTTDDTDSRLLYLPDSAFDDCVELIDGVIATLHSLEHDLRAHFFEARPVSPSLILGMLKLSRAGCRTVSSMLLEAEGDSER